MDWTRALSALILAVSSLGALAQDMEPRIYSASPVGTTFLNVTFGRSSGDVTFDPTIPITDVQATLYSPALGVSHTFGLFGRQTLLSVAVPYVWGHVTGNVGDQAAEVYRSGGGDLRARYSVNLHGSPAMSPKEFARRHRTYILAASVTMQAPSGQYGGTKLINIGANRWAFKPEVGFSYPVKRLDLDFYLGGWLFTDNNNYYPGGEIRSQRPLGTVQAHVSYTTRRRLWVAFDSTWYGGGAVSVDGGPLMDRLSNSKLGVTGSLPLPHQQSIKVAYSSAVYGVIGAKLNTVTVGWQKTWFH
jgi:Putative MetA-pathway of phenol degradation